MDRSLDENKEKKKILMNERSLKETNERKRSLTDVDKRMFAK